MGAHRDIRGPGRVPHVVLPLPYQHCAGEWSAGRSGRFLAAAVCDIGPMRASAAVNNAVIAPNLRLRLKQERFYRESATAPRYGF
jgi:hypothetical protein